MTDTMTARQQALELLETDGTKHLSDGAIENLRRWLTEERYSEYVPTILEHMQQGKWQILDDVFWTVIPFGTGGRRGRMYPIGSNAINDRTIGESAQGLADYVKENPPHDGPFSCGIAYDTRHQSDHFARLCAEIMTAAGFIVYFLDEYRSTPELSFLVRFKQCSCGIMVTASHNPPSDNAVKVYWATGGQILPPHDRGVIDKVMSVDRIERQDFQAALDAGQIVLCRDEVDRAYIAAVHEQAFAGPRDASIEYSPLHGVGTTAVVPALRCDRFEQVEVFADHAEPNGDFPNVPNHVANPENAAVFDAIIARAKQIGADVCLATDPDCDRLGVASPCHRDVQGPWKSFNGNQIAALLADYVLEQRQAQGTLTAEHYVVKTLVTTDMVRRIADSYAVRTIGDLLVGFKWIGGVMDDQGPERFVFGCEESHGYLVGQYARDKDGAVAAMLMSELTARLKSQGQTLHEKLEALYWQHGYHAERLLTLQMPGSEGMERMEELMEQLRSQPPESLGGLAVTRVRDYKRQKQIQPGESAEPLTGPVGDLVFFDLADPGNYVAARPSGTEPKIKFYMFTFVPAEQLASLEEAASAMSQRLDQIERDLRQLSQP